MAKVSVIVPVYNAGPYFEKRMESLIAQTLSDIIGYSFQQRIVLKKVGGNPYSPNTVKQLALILFLLGCNALLPHRTANPYIDGLYRTFLIGGGYFALMYKWRISEEVCSLIKRRLHL